MTLHLSLYSTEHCHLCEQAIELIDLALAEQDVQYKVIDIVESATLLALYEFKIPVLKREDTNAEICWPFNIQEINRLIS